LTTATPVPANEAVLHEALTGLTTAPQKTLPPWLFYDERGSQLFEQITELPEYYLTRTERALFAAHADDILSVTSSDNITIAELGAGTATKTGLLLRAALRRQPKLLYQPIDVSSSALAAAAESLTLPNLTVHPQVANYITERYTLQRPDSPKLKGHSEQGSRHRILALYIGSSIGNFSPAEAHSILHNLRQRLQPGDALLLGADLAPGPQKPIATILSAYDDAAGITAAFNLNILTRLNRELDADFNLAAFAHRARWNAAESRIEMHLESLRPQTVTIPTNDEIHHIAFEQGETIHTENSYKFTPEALTTLLTTSGFTPTRTFHDPTQTFALTLAHTL
jgi:L-histidine Nalpha-methyltransferase